MTAICAAGGPSSPKTGTDPVTRIVQAGIGAILQKYGIRWSVAYATLLEAQTYVLEDFCSVDPPELPTFDAADVFAMFGLDPIAKASASLKFAQLVGHYAWFEFCHCDDDSEGAPTAPPSAPTGAPITVTPTVPTEPCDHHAAFGLTFTPGTNRNVDVFGNHPGSPAGLTDPEVLVPGARTMVVTGTRIAAGATHQFISFNVQFWTTEEGGSQITVFSNTVNTTGPQTQTWQFAVPTNAIGWTATLQGGVNSQTDQADMTVDFYCGDDVPGGSESACCAPDDTLQALILQVLQQVNLLQRHLIPFATVDGDTHGPLMGEGGFSVQGLVGLRIALTISGSLVGTVDNNPDRIFNAGWIAIETESGTLERKQLDAALTEWLPPKMTDATNVAYFLTPGVTMNVTDLEREP